MGVNRNSAKKRERRRRKRRRFCALFKNEAFKAFSVGALPEGFYHRVLKAFENHHIVDQVMAEVSVWDHLFDWREVRSVVQEHLFPLATFAHNLYLRENAIANGKKA